MIKVLIVDDSSIIRQYLKKTINTQRDMELVGSAENPFEGRDLIVTKKPDIMILDVEMPRMDGVTFLKKVMQMMPMPIVMFSSLTKADSPLALEALKYGALDVVHKPDGDRYCPDRVSEELCAKIRAFYKAKVRKIDVNALNAVVPQEKAIAFTNPNKKVVLVGSSTGGTEVLRYLLPKLPTTAPPIVIVQHMPPAFTALFAKHLNDMCKVEVAEAKHGDRLQNGKVFIAPGDKHMVLQKTSLGFIIQLHDGPKVGLHKPAVNELFNSVAKKGDCKDIIALMLTGMGKDGADGMEKLFAQGAETIAQSEKSCVVFGMPGEVVKRGVAKQILDKEKIIEGMIKVV